MSYFVTGIGYNVTISAPRMHGHALELLKDHLQDGMKALDVGSGSGYLTSNSHQISAIIDSAMFEYFYPVTKARILELAGFWCSRR